MSFTRTYEGEVVSLTAPTPINSGNDIFWKWDKDGVFYSNSNAITTDTAANHTMVAFYRPASTAACSFSAWPVVSYTDKIIYEVPATVGDSHDYFSIATEHIALPITMEFTFDYNQAMAIYLHQDPCNWERGGIGTHPTNHGIRITSDPSAGGGSGRVIVDGAVADIDQTFSGLVGSVLLAPFDATVVWKVIIDAGGTCKIYKNGVLLTTSTGNYSGVGHTFCCAGFQNGSFITTTHSRITVTKFGHGT